MTEKVVVKEARKAVPGAALDWRRKYLAWKQHVTDNDPLDDVRWGNLQKVWAAQARLEALLDVIIGLDNERK